ncbi:hypothetical protein DSLASN_06770 [Desulfoluna limicola]|uniref:Uncharacterized protein n=1 Tax=Desulfoluna limicola TaxID=2810562 RepID=A0ABN6F193_9BACT|nr:hypothetical protein DSLASN_06770 [Desulfoluna limicola]
MRRNISVLWWEDGRSRGEPKYLSGLGFPGIIARNTFCAKKMYVHIPSGAQGVYDEQHVAKTEMIFTSWRERFIFPGLEIAGQLL